MPQTSLTAWLTQSVRTQKSEPQTSSRNAAELDEGGKDSTNPPPPPTSPPTTTDELGTSSTATPYGTAMVNQRGTPANVELRACTRDDIPHFKRLNSLLLPIPYSEKFYREITDDPLTRSITLVAVWHDDPAAAGKEKGRLVGAIRCRILPHPPLSNEPSSWKSGPMLYLSTLVLLSPYRGYGIAVTMLDTLVKRVVKAHGVTTVGAHVWDANLDGQEWYRKRGFRQVGREDDYYQRLKPRSAVFMQKNIGVMDLMTERRDE